MQEISYLEYCRRCSDRRGDCVMTMKKEKKEGERRGYRTSVNKRGPTISLGNKISKTRL